MHYCRELLTGEKEGLLQLPTDKALIEDPKFRPYVEAYAAVRLEVSLSFLQISDAILMDHYLSVVCCYFFLLRCPTACFRLFGVGCYFVHIILSVYLWDKS